MEQFIGTKIVQAEPAMKCWGHKGQAHDAGLILTQEQYDGMVAEGWEPTEVRHGYKVVYQGGYESWSPKEVFEAAYRRTNGMSFGLALEACKMGKRIARRGWNGKNMSVAYQRGYPDGIPCNENTAKAWGMEVGELFKCRPYLQLRCADGSFQMWVASQSDILADDWCVLEDAETMSWEDALKEVEAGAAVRRKGWGDASWVAILEEPAELKGKLCKVCPDTGDITPDWKPEGEDLEARDWEKLWGV